MKCALKYFLPVAICASTLFVAACDQRSPTGTTSAQTRASVHVGYGRGAYWRWGGYYPPPPDIIVPPETEFPPIAVPLPEPDFGGGDFGGGDFGGDFDF